MQKIRRRLTYMRKIYLSMIVLLVSTCCFAQTSDGVSSTILNAMHQRDSQSPMSLSMIYGGQDFSHPKVAVANESIWSEQVNLVG